MARSLDEHFRRSVVGGSRGLVALSQKTEHEYQIIGSLVAR